MTETSADSRSTVNRPPRRRPGRKVLAIGVVAAVVIAGGVIGGMVATSGGGTSGRLTSAANSPTVAGSPPQLTAGRGASVPFVEFEAANAKTNGQVLAETRTAGTLAGEAIGRRAVTLTGAGKYVEFTLTQPANSIDVRYSIPDSADGSDYTASLSVYVDGAKQKDLTLTNRYSWYYGAYPFVNKPSSGNAHHLYDETHELLDKRYPAGSKVRLQIDAEDTAKSYTIDLADFEDVAPPLPQPAHSISVTDLGADPTGKQDSTDAFKKAIATAAAKGTAVWIPEGTFEVNKHLIVSNNLTIEGAGPWYSAITGNGVGVYGNAAPKPSLNVHLSDFAIEGTVNERVDADQVNGLGGGMGGGSTIENLWIEHTKVGMWFDGPFDGLTIEGNRIDDTTADGINLHDGITNSTVTNNFIRNTGDDGIATWAEHDSDSDDVIGFNTVEAPMLANNIAVYGGADNKVTDNVVSDTQTQGGGIHVGNRFNATSLTGTTTIARDTTLRAGDLDPNWKYGVGALWFWADDSPMTGAIRVRDVDLIDSSYEGIEFVGSSVSNVDFTDVAIEGAGTFALQLESHGGASFEHVVATDVGAPVGRYDCLVTGSSTPAFTITDRGGNAGLAKTFCGPWPKPRYSYSYPAPTGSGNFALTASPAKSSVVAGGTASVDIATSVATGASQPLTLSARGAPAGVDVHLSTTSVAAGGHSTMTLSTSTSTPPGSYPITVTASAPSRSHTTTYTLTVADVGATTLSAKPTSLSFDGQSVGAASPAQSVVLTNNGSRPVTISSITATGDYTQTNSCVAELQPGASCAVSVTLIATAPGQRSGAIEVADDANPVTVPLSGAAVGSSNLALNKAATASGTQPGYPTTNMTDGNTGSYWESTNRAFPQWAQVDLGAVQPVSRLVLTLPPPSAWSKRTQTFSVLVSTDGTTFTAVAPSGGHTFDPATGNTVTVKFPSVKARYVRIDVTANDGWPAAQVSEFEVFQ